MGKKEKLFDKAQRSPQGLNFDDFETLLSLCGLEFKHQRGSHRFWYSPLQYRLSIQLKKMVKQKHIKLNNFYNNTRKKMNKPINYDWDGYKINLFKL